MSCGELCTRKVVVAGKGAAIVEVARLMRQYHVGDVVIVERGQDQAVPLGIITDRDIVVGLVASETDLGAVTVADVMSFELVTVGEADMAWDALAKMRRKGVRRLLVVNDQGGLEGILTGDDMLEVLAEEVAMLAKVAGRAQRREEEARS
ncbi:MAG: CBS domain-containing protein [Thermodesulfobacteriota bacterium]